MKKTLLNVTFSLALIGGAYGQLEKAHFSVKNLTEKPVSEEHFTPKAPGIVVWSNTFNDQNLWTISAPNIQGQWQWVTTTPAQLNTYVGAMASTTANDGFAAFNGVQYLLAGPVESQDASITYDGSIDFSTENDLLFVFEQRYRAFNTDETWIEFSTNGGASWSGFQVNQAVVTNDPATQNTVSVNVSSIVGGQSDVTFRFRWFNPSNNDQFGSGYGWMVDDVRFVTLPDNDITTDSLYFGSVGLPYYIIPQQQITAIDFSVKAYNTGVNTQNGVRLQAVESTAGFSETSPAASIAALDSATLVVSNSFTPAGLGNYTVDFSILNDSLDDDPTNNTLPSYSFTVGNNIYARDRNSAQGSYGQQSLEGGNIFDIFAAQDLYGIDVRFGATLDPDIEVYGRLYDITNVANIDDGFLAETQTMTTTSGMASTLQTLRFSSPINLVPGNTYLVTAGSFFEEFSISTSGSSSIGTTYLYGDLGAPGLAWYWAPSTVMVRMNFDISLSVDDINNEMASSLYPNPTQGNSTLELQLLNDASISINVVDVTGQSVYSSDVSNFAAGNHKIDINTASLSSGIYFVNINNGANSASKKLVVHK